MSLSIGFTGTREGMTDDGEGGYLPDSVQEWAGLSNFDVNITTDYGDETTLAGLNDDNKSFEFIASVIENQL